MWRFYYRYGMLKTVGQCDEANMKTGLWKTYYDDEQLETTGNYSAGEKTGKWSFYQKNGKPESVGNYEDGLNRRMELLQ